MVCIYCGSATNVINSRLQKRVNQVWRRRQCERCHAVFTTHEVADLALGLRIEWTDGKLVPFMRDKVFIDLYDSLGHRSDALSAAGALATTITAQLLKAAQSAKITRSDLISTTLIALQRFDSVAAVHYKARHTI
jgi:transcriptional regulator NrdR family protein